MSLKSCGFDPLGGSNPQEVKTMYDELKKLIKDAVKSQQEDCGCSFDIPEIELEHPKDARFGDLSTNSAMKIGKQQGKSRPDPIGDLRKKQKADSGGPDEGIQTYQSPEPFLNGHGKNGNENKKADGNAKEKHGGKDPGPPEGQRVRFRRILRKNLFHYAIPKACRHHPPLPVQPKLF